MDTPEAILLTIEQAAHSKAGDLDAACEKIDVMENDIAYAAETMILTADDVPPGSVAAKLLHHIKEMRKGREPTWARHKDEIRELCTEHAVEMQRVCDERNEFEVECNRLRREAANRVQSTCPNTKGCGPVETLRRQLDEAAEMQYRRG